jgi:hypothetical protein
VSLKSITESAFRSAAEELGVEPAVIKAVDEVESRGDGFLPDGRVKILFERHKFHHFTHGKFSASHPDISSPKSGGYGKAGAHQYARFSEAFALDPIAAMKSASWGKFQIMGFNHEAAGFKTVGEFVDAMKVSEDEQLKAFVNLIKSFGLVGELRAHDWASFARQYNGAAYKKNNYDAKMAAAYERFKKEPPVEVADSPAPIKDEPAKSEVSVTPGVTEKKVAPVVNVEHAEKVDAAVPPPPGEVKVQSLAQSLLSKVMAGGTAVMGVLTAIFGFFTQAFDKHPLPMTILVLGILAISAYMWNESKKRRDAREALIVQKAASQTENTVRITG